jgi:predicted NUDIX family NTP pyrophosphohydrolase
VPAKAAGILLFRVASGRSEADLLQVLVAHMGGPFWSRKDEGAWTIPKGEIEPGESPEEAARREFREELGLPPPDGPLRPLGDFPQTGKHVTAFALEGDVNPEAISSNRFEMEWPRGSGRVESFPEIDRAEWVDPGLAARRLVRGQVPIVETLRRLLVDQGRIAP